MSTIYVADGNTVLDPTGHGGYTKDELVGLPTGGATQERIGVAVKTYLTSEIAVLFIGRKTISTTVKKAGALETWEPGKRLYYTSTGAWTTVATSNGSVVGLVAEFAATGATTGRVIINP